MVEIYVGVRYSPSTNMGGWGVVLIEEGERPKKCNGSETGADELDEILSGRHVQAVHIAKHKWLGEAQLLAKDAIGS